MSFLRYEYTYKGEKEKSEVLGGNGTQVKEKKKIEREGMKEDAIDFLQRTSL